MIGEPIGDADVDLEETDSTAVTPPQITVITVVRNAADAVAETIHSVAEQSGRIEHLLIDGASTDNTLETIRQHANNRCRIISEPDRGIYDAMNKGLRLARGEWVIFMNAGDTFYSSRVTKDVLPHMETCRDVLLGETIVTFRDSLETRRFHKYPTPASEWWKGMPTCHQSVFYRREKLIRFPFNLHYTWCADYDQFVRIIRGGANVATLPFIASIYDGNGADHRDPRVYIRERKEISRQLKNGPWQRAYFMNESFRLAFFGTAIEFLKRITPDNWRMRLRRLRGTAGETPQPSE